MYWIILILLFTLLLHEFGHYLSAKIQGLIVDKFSFSLKPIPHLYVSIIDNKISLRKRILFLLSGNMIIILSFLIFLLSGFECKYIYYAFAYQIILDTNPFFSDYVITIISYLYKKEIYHSFIENKMEVDINNLKKKYMFSPIWYIHFVLWGILIIFIVSPSFLNIYF